MGSDYEGDDSHVGSQMEHQQNVTNLDGDFDSDDEFVSDDSLEKSPEKDTSQAAYNFFNPLGHLADILKEIRDQKRS